MYYKKAICLPNLKVNVLRHVTGFLGKALTKTTMQHLCSRVAGWGM